MSSKGHSKRTRMPVSVRNGSAEPISKLELADDETVRSDSAPLVVAPSSPEAASLSSAPAEARPPTPLECSEGGPLDHALPIAHLPSAERLGDAVREDGSVPPVDVDSHFFNASPASADASLEIEARDPRLALKWTASAARRRAHLAKYVTVTVALASALCMAALVKVGTSRNEDGVGQIASSAHREAVKTTTPGALNPVPATDSVPSTAPQAASGAALLPAGASAAEAPAGERVGASASVATAPPSGTATSTAAVPATPASTAPPQTTETAAGAAGGAAAEAAGTPIAAAPAAAPAEPRSASREKSRSQASLEAGRLGESIAAGERSVALDATDAEAWLILGAAYQARGSLGEATRCFRTCIERSTHGPKSECAAMVR